MIRIFRKVTTSCVLCVITEIEPRKGIGTVESINPGSISGIFQLKHINDFTPRVGMKVYALIATTGGTKKGFARNLVTASGKDYVNEERVWPGILQQS